MKYDPESLWELRKEVSSRYVDAVNQHKVLVDDFVPEIMIIQDQENIDFWIDIIEMIDMVGEDLISHQKETEIVESKEEGCGIGSCPDMVNQPYHYTTGKYEVIDVIKDWLTPEEFSGYTKGNLIKYIARERHKNGPEDLKKAEFYLHYLNSNGEKGVK